MSSYYRRAKESKEQDSDLSSCRNGTQPHVPTFFPLHPGTVMSHLSIHLWKDEWLQETRKESEVLRQNPRRRGEVLGTEVVNLAEVWMGNLGSYWGEEVTICYLVPTFLYRWGNAGPGKEMTCPRSQDFSWLRERSSPYLCLSSLHSLYGTTSVFHHWVLACL